MANGKVITGYSFPRVALYTNTQGTVSYSGGMALARGVDVNIEPSTGDVENFYADNRLAESAGGVFTGGTVTLTVDGLKEAARTLIMGLPEPEQITVGEGQQQQQVDVYNYGDNQAIPYVGIGFVVRMMEENVTTYRPFVLTKCIFNQEGLEAETQEENISFQTSELEAQVMRDDSANHNWKKVGADQATEEAAVAVVNAILGITGA